MARKKKPEIDFETYCKVKHDGDEYSALKALSLVTIEDSTAVAGLSDEGYRAVCDSLTRSQLSTLWEHIRISLQEDPVRLAEFLEFCEQKEKEEREAAERNRSDAPVNSGSEEGGAAGYVITFFVGMVFSVVIIIGVILGWISLGYILYVIADVIVSLKISDKIKGFFRKK